MNRRALCVFVLVLNSGCGEASKPYTVTGTSDDPVMHVGADDSEMNAAMTKARETVDKFIMVLNKPGPGQSHFSVKKPFKTRKNSEEHIWLENIKFDGKDFVGTVGNDPDDVKGIKYGDVTKVAKGEISDWLYKDNGLVAGAYTLRVLKKIAVGADAEEMKDFKFKD